MTNNKHVLVEFYAPWCGHCKALAPEYEKAATTLNEDEDTSAIKLAKVDATVESDLGTKYKVRGYPTLKFFKDGKDSEYGGGRTAPEIVNWLKKKTGPPAKELGSDEDVTKIKANNEVVVIGHFTDMGSDAGKKFIEVADTVDDVVFAYITDAGVASRATVNTNEVVIFKKFDEGRAEFKGDITNGDELAEFVKGNQLPLVTEFTSETAPKIFGGEIQVHNLLFISKASEEFDQNLAQFKEAAANFKGKVLFIYVDTETEDNQRVMEFFGLAKDDIPDYRIIKMSENMAKFKPDTKDLSADAITKFTEGVLTGDTKRHLMSADIPEDWNKGPVKVLVGKNFKEIAFDKSKKVFVEFYAPWCGHCKSLAPTWEKLGEKFGSNDDVIIAKMDSTANEVEDFEISGFPTLKFFPSGSDKILDYEGDRTVDAMAEYVESNGEKVSGGGEEESEEVCSCVDGCGFNNLANFFALTPNNSLIKNVHVHYTKQVCVLEGRLGSEKVFLICAF
uniref:Protein disulfide-isomerase n=1 Tax=Phallusia mammillata TaxID=59560 RepID=A0A6F9DC45_9ASCI|nr:protein disulfide-isomerase 2 [Phallusia mammillata]